MKQESHGFSRVECQAVRPYSSSGGKTRVLVACARYRSRSARHMIHRRPHRWARKAPAAMRRRTVEADTPRYAAASPTENSGLGENVATSAAAGGRPLGMLVGVRDVDTGRPSG